MVVFSGSTYEKKLAHLKDAHKNITDAISVLELLHETVYKHFMAKDVGRQLDAMDKLNDALKSLEDF